MHNLRSKNKKGFLTIRYAQDSKWQGIGLSFRRLKEGGIALLEMTIAAILLYPIRMTPLHFLSFRRSVATEKSLILW